MDTDKEDGHYPSGRWARCWNTAEELHIWSKDLYSCKRRMVSWKRPCGASITARCGLTHW